MKITACVIQEKGPGGARRVCSVPLARSGYGWWPCLAKRTCGSQGCLCWLTLPWMGLVIARWKHHFSSCQISPEPCGSICLYRDIYAVSYVHTYGLEFLLNTLFTSYRTQSTIRLNSEFSSPRTLLFKPILWQRIPKEQQNLPQVIFISLFYFSLFLTIHCWFFIRRKQETEPDTNGFIHTSVCKVFVNRTAECLIDLPVKYGSPGYLCWLICLQYQCVFVCTWSTGKWWNNWSDPERWKFLCTDSAAFYPPKLGLSSMKKCQFESIIRKVCKMHCFLSLWSHSS